MLQRIKFGDLDAIRHPLELFNELFENAIGAADERNPSSRIHIEGATVFGRQFVDRLLGSIALTSERSQYGFEAFVVGNFKPLQRILKSLGLSVRREGWPHNDIALGQLLLIVDYFNAVVEEEWGF